MNFDWTAEVVGRMHMAAITGKQLADEAGLTNSYLSAVLHNKKGNATTQQRIIDALERLEQRQASEPTVKSVRNEESIMANVKIDCTQIPRVQMDILCRTLLAGIERFYSDPENLRRYEAWLQKCREEGKFYDDDTQTAAQAVQ